MVYLLDPASPATVKTFPIAAPIAQGIINHPVGVAVSNFGNVYLTIFVEGGTGFSSFFKLDTTNGSLTDYHITGPQFYVDGFPQDVHLKTAISSDNSRAFFNNDGIVFSVDTASDQLFFGTVGQGCCYGNYELSLSPNQTRLTATNYIYDSDMNGESYYTVNDREYDVLYVYGAKLSPDGGLLFQPSANGTDIYDARLGMLRHRVALPYPLSPNYDALVQNGKDNTLLAITGNNGDGIAILDFNSMAEPAPLPTTWNRRLNLAHRGRKSGDTRCERHPHADTKQLLGVAFLLRVVPCHISIIPAPFLRGEPVWSMPFGAVWVLCFFHSSCGTH